MKQVIQSISDGSTIVAEVPVPVVGDADVLVAVSHSLISSGTERYVVDLARKSLLEKARARPDHVKRIWQKVRQEGLASTVSQVRAKLAEPMPLGYSAAGVVLSCGRATQGFKPGDRVAVAAPHASAVTVGRNLCAAIPDAVAMESAAYAPVAAIAMQGVRLAKVSLGESVLVIGLGLIGQITVALLRANGCRVFGTDLDPAKLDLARTLGLDEGSTGSPRDAIMRFSAGRGVDAVLITAATESNEPIELSADVCRPKGRIVLVGVAGLTLPRAPFFQKELEFTVSSSLGAGRGDPSYEEKGIDYPIGYARWTAQRNMEAVLALMAAGKLPVEKLTTHRFAIDAAPVAYNLVATRGEPHLGILLTYPDLPPEAHAGRRVALSSRAHAGTIGVSLIGAGNFARLVIMPAVAKEGDLTFRGICTAKGLNAVGTGSTYGFAFAATDVEEVFQDDRTNAVIVATRHDLHAALVVAALRAGKHVFVEKPLCISADELALIALTIDGLGAACPLLMVGFNRHFAPAMEQIREHFDGAVPLSVSYRFAPGELPAASWPQDIAVGGGRIVGEACHAIEACAAIHGSVPVRVYAESVGNVGGLSTTDDRVFITLRHANGGVSSISYQAGGDRSGPIERIEVFGGGRTAVVEGWDRVDLWSASRHSTKRGGKDKGHAAGFAAFLNAVRKGGPWPISWDDIRSTTWASLAAVDSLRTGLPMDAEPRG